jgi:hypothetical protein
MFFATEALIILHWSRLSGHVGRKPVSLIGLFGPFLCSASDCPRRSEAWSSGLSFESALFSRVANCQNSIQLILSWKKRKTAASSILQSPPAPSSSSNLTVINNNKPLPIRALLSRRVLIASGSYAGIALIDIAFRTVQPVFYATPISLGGLRLNTPTIGTILAVQGIVNGLVHLLISPKLHDIMGPKNLFLFAVASASPMLALSPVMNVPVRFSGDVHDVWSLVELQVALSSFTNFAYGLLLSVSH